MIYVYELQNYIKPEPETLEFAIQDYDYDAMWILALLSIAVLEDFILRSSKSAV